MTQNKTYCISHETLEILRKKLCKRFPEEDITSLQPGEHFNFKGYEWVCLDPEHKDNGVLAIMAKPWGDEIMFYPNKNYADDKGNWNNYKTSNIRELLTNQLKIKLGQENLGIHIVNLTADNGDTSYGSAVDSVFLLTCDEYRKYRDFIPYYSNWIWTATPYACGDENTFASDAHLIRGVASYKQFANYYTDLLGHMVPACIFKKTLKLRDLTKVMEK